jgi:hypothetical protein
MQKNNAGINKSHTLNITGTIINTVLVRNTCGDKKKTEREVMPALRLSPHQY